MILKFFILWRLGLLIIALLGSLSFAQVANGSPGSMAEGKKLSYWLSWAQWDGGHYLQIAQSGYQNQTDTAFFPLYPLLIKTITPVFYGNFVAAGLIISNVSFLIFLIILYKLTLMHFDSNTAKTSLISLLFFPTTFFAVSLYSEGLYLLLSTLSLLLYHRGKKYQSLLAAGVAAITRPFGLLLIIALITAETFKLIKKTDKTSKLKRLTTYLIISLSPFAIFNLFLTIKFSQPLPFINVQSLWGREIVDPATTFLAYAFNIITFRILSIPDYLDVLIPLSFLFVLFSKSSKIPQVIWLYSVLVILISASFGTLSGLGRYSLGATGAFMAMGQILEGRPKLQPFVFGAFLSLQVYLLVRFFNGYWAG